MVARKTVVFDATKSVDDPRRITVRPITWPDCLCETFLNVFHKKGEKHT